MRPVDYPGICVTNAKNYSAGRPAQNCRHSSRRSSSVMSSLSWPVRARVIERIQALYASNVSSLDRLKMTAPRRG